MLLLRLIIYFVLKFIRAASYLQNIERYVQQKTLHAEKLTAVPIEEYPFMSVNKVSIAPFSCNILVSWNINV